MEREHKLRWFPAAIALSFLLILALVPVHAAECIVLNDTVLLQSIGNGSGMSITSETNYTDITINDTGIYFGSGVCGGTTSSDDDENAAWIIFLLGFAALVLFL